MSMSVIAWPGPGGALADTGDATVKGNLMVTGNLHIQAPPGTDTAWIIASTGTMTLNALQANTVNVSGDVSAGGKIFAGPIHNVGQPGDISTDRGGNSGTLYFGGGPSQYLHYSGGAFHFAGGNVNVPNLTGSALNATWVNTGTCNVSGNIHLSGGHGLYFEASHVVRTYWDGTWMRFSHPAHFDSHVHFASQIHIAGRLITNNWDIGWPNSLGGGLAISDNLSVATGASVGHALTVGGAIHLNGAVIYFEPSNQVYINWRGDLAALYIPYGNGIYIHAITLAGNGTCTGTWSMAGLHVTTASATMSGGWNAGTSTIWPDNQLHFQDGNVRMYRVPGANWFQWQVWDGRWDFIRTHDGHMCGYIDPGGFHSTSDLKTKVNITPMNDGLRMVLDSRVRPIRYAVPGIPEQHHVKSVDREGHDIEMDMPSQPDYPCIGFGAQDMELVCPEVVGHDPQDGHPDSINYGELVAVLWDAVRTLNARDEMLERRVAELEGRAA